MRYPILFILILSLSLTALAQSGGVKGKVKNEDERGLAGVSVTVSQEGKTFKNASTDSKGEFFITGLADGLYVLHFEKDGYSSGSFRTEVKKGKVKDLSGRNFILPQDRGNLVTIQGGVFDATGFSVQGARVEISRLTAGGAWDKIKAIYSSQDGEFVFRFPPTDKEATYRVTVTYKNIEPQVKEKTTDSAGIYRLSFNLPLNISGPKQTDMTKP
jgi:hypothetical protein